MVIQLSITENYEFLPGIDFPNSRYSRTDGLKNPIGISGESSLSSKFCFVSVTILNGETGALVFLTVVGRFCVSDVQSIDQLNNLKNKIN